MTAQHRLIEIICNAIEIGANDIHFMLENNGLVLIQLRTGNLMVPYLQITPENYKQILDYIELHTTFETFSKGQMQMGIVTLNDNRNVLECFVSILPITKFKSLVLRLNKSPNKKNKNLRRYLENLPSGLIEAIILK